MPRRCFAVELVEPINIAILPLAFLALGAATGVRLTSAQLELAADPPRYRPLEMPAKKRPKVSFAGVVTGIAVLMALFVGVTMVVGDAYMFRGMNFAVGQPYNLASAKDSNELLSYWPDSALEVAQIEAYDSATGRSLSSAPPG